MYTVKSIVTEAVLQFLNEGLKDARPLNVKGLGVLQGFDVPVKNLDKPLPKILKPNPNVKIPTPLGTNIGLNEDEKTKKLEEFLKNLKIGLLKK